MRQLTETEAGIIVCLYRHGELRVERRRMSAQRLRLLLTDREDRNQGTITVALRKLRDLKLTMGCGAHPSQQVYLLMPGVELVRKWRQAFASFGIERATW